ncbi:Inositol oxygenase 4 [Spatholobus suberectus]|nr:Inositol oxygenase 4 [Spatholobus suberectus]
MKDYDAESKRQKGVEEFYRLQHINQAYDFVKRMRGEYEKLVKAEMGIWECCELLNEVVDESDPDLDEPQIQHLLQSAEAIKKDYPNEDWLHLTALIHALYFSYFQFVSNLNPINLTKFIIFGIFVGDTFPLGCAFNESNIHHKYFKDNPDYKCLTYNTKNGIYTEGCGLDNIVMSWGHDDYLYMVAKENALHKEGAYTHLMNEEDIENLKWLKIFKYASSLTSVASHIIYNTILYSKYDLYSKSKVLVDVEKVKPYYVSLIEKSLFFYVGIFLRSLNGEPFEVKGPRRLIIFSYSGERLASHWHLFNGELSSGSIQETLWSELCAGTPTASFNDVWMVLFLQDGARASATWYWLQFQGGYLIVWNYCVGFGSWSHAFLQISFLEGEIGILCLFCASVLLMTIQIGLQA